MATQNFSENLVNAVVSVGEETVDYVSVTLDRAFGRHHRFSVLTDYDAVTKKFPVAPPSQIGLIGKPPTITATERLGKFPSVQRAYSKINIDGGDKLDAKTREIKMNR